MLSETLCCTYLGFVEKGLYSTLHEEVCKIQNQYNSKEIMGKNRLSFSPFLFPNILSASASIPGKICFSFEWARKLIFGDEKARNAFLFTLGHELSHKDNEPSKKIKAYLNVNLPFRFLGSKNDLEDYSFFRWVMEVNCDMLSGVKMFQGKKEKVLEGIDYMISQKPNNHDSLLYPSWERRREYAATGNFDEALIRRIAKDTKCGSEELINRVCEHYQNFYVHLT